MSSRATAWKGHAGGSWSRCCSGPPHPTRGSRSPRKQHPPALPHKAPLHGGRIGVAPALGWEPFLPPGTQAGRAGGLTGLVARCQESLRSPGQSPHPAGPFGCQTPVTNEVREGSKDRGVSWVWAVGPCPLPLAASSSRPWLAHGFSVSRCSGSNSRWAARASWRRGREPENALRPPARSRGPRSAQLLFAAPS